MTTQAARASTDRRLALFMRRALAMRKNYDLRPWIEVVTEQVPDAANHLARWSVQKDYALLISEVTTAGHALFGGGVSDSFITGPLFNWSTGPLKREAQKQAIPVRHVLGTRDDGWIGLGHGRHIARNTLWSAEATLVDGVNVDDEASWALALRGYRLDKKGRSPQKTIAEYLKEGYRLEPYTYARTVRVDTTSTNESALAEIKFDANFLVSTMIVAVRDGDAAGLVMAAKVESHLGELQNDWIPVHAIAGTGIDTAWHMPIPCEVPKGERWNVRAKPLSALAGGEVEDVDFVFHGHLILPPAPGQTRQAARR